MDGARLVKPAILVARGDTVAVALRSLAAGETVAIGDLTVTLRQSVPEGHKFAVAAMRRGASVFKFGWPIGVATADIEAGAHVHSHNLKTSLDGDEAYEFTQPAAVPREAESSAFFEGYRRANGAVGVRNEIWIVATVGCVAEICESVAREATLRHAGAVDGVVAITHPFGCSLGDDLTHTRSILAALASHPNAGGVVFVGLGCESNKLEALMAAAGATRDAARVRWVLAQAVEDEIEAIAHAVDDLAQVVALDLRSRCPVADLTIGVKCGGSDGLSGLTANPLVGRMVDRVAAAGGTAILTEIPEIFGAERLLMRRAADQLAFESLVGIVNDFKQYFRDHNQPIYENPSPGNIEGGITTLEEKSLGAVQKAGAVAPVTDVLRYGQRVRRTGLTVLEAPGNDAVSGTALVAAGATIVLFTTGRGTPLGFSAPTLKIASNSGLAGRKSGWIDFDAGSVLHDSTSDEASDRLFQLLVATASGRRTRSEDRGSRTVAIWKRGVTL